MIHSVRTFYVEVSAEEKLVLSRCILLAVTHYYVFLLGQLILL